jgi:hypothetical protein
MEKSFGSLALMLLIARQQPARSCLIATPTVARGGSWWAPILTITSGSKATPLPRTLTPEIRLVFRGCISIGRGSGMEQPGCSARDRFAEVLRSLLARPRRHRGRKQSRNQSTGRDQPKSRGGGSPATKRSSWDQAVRWHRRTSRDQVGWSEKSLQIGGHFSNPYRANFLKCSI